MSSTLRGLGGSGATATLAVVSAEGVVLAFDGETPLDEAAVDPGLGASPESLWQDNESSTEKRTM